MKTNLKPEMWLPVGAGVTSVILNVTLWLMALFLFPQDKLAAVLHYNTSIGIDFIGEGTQIKVIPTIGTALLLVNAVIAIYLQKISRKAASMFWGVLPIIEGLLLLAFLLILRLNR